MSTSETDTFDLGPCPCGAGHIAKHVTTQDNPWSSADVAYSIECARCSNEWYLDYGTLVLRASERGYNRARENERATYAPLAALTDRIVADYMSNIAARTKKAEHSEMVRLGITGMSYRQYLEHRRGGHPASSACVGLRNESWLLSEATARSLDQELLALMDAHSIARATTSAESKKIVRRRIP
jgi:hypothetical protein